MVIRCLERLSDHNYCKYNRCESVSTVIWGNSYNVPLCFHIQINYSDNIVVLCNQISSKMLFTALVHQLAF